MQLSEDIVVKVRAICKVIQGYKFTLASEEALKAEMADALIAHGVNVLKEHVLNKENRLDFFFHGLAVEVKIKGQRRAIFKQCERYCSFDEVKGLLLITNKAMALPEKINGKPCFVFRLGKSWL